MSIADLLLACYLACYHVFIPDALSAYPQLQQLRTFAEERLSGWRIIHKEFELLRQCTLPLSFRPPAYIYYLFYSFELLLFDDFIVF